MWIFQTEFTSLVSAFDRCLNRHKRGYIEKIMAHRSWYERCKFGFENSVANFCKAICSWIFLFAIHCGHRTTMWLTDSLIEDVITRQKQYNSNAKRFHLISLGNVKYNITNHLFSVMPWKSTENAQRRHSFFPASPLFDLTASVWNNQDTSDRWVGIAIIDFQRYVRQPCHRIGKQYARFQNTHQTCVLSCAGRLPREARKTKYANIQNNLTQLPEYNYQISKQFNTIIFTFF